MCLGGQVLSCGDLWAWRGCPPPTGPVSGSPGISPGPELPRTVTHPPSAGTQGPSGRSPCPLPPCPPSPASRLPTLALALLRCLCFKPKLHPPTVPPGWVPQAAPCLHRRPHRPSYELRELCGLSATSPSPGWRWGRLLRPRAPQRVLGCIASLQSGGLRPGPKLEPPQVATRQQLGHSFICISVWLEVGAGRPQGRPRAPFWG